MSFRLTHWLENEISGTLILGILSADIFLRNRDQQDINLHNVINEWFSVRTKHVAAWVMLIDGILFPVAASQNRVRLIFEIY